MCLEKKRHRESCVTMVFYFSPDGHTIGSNDWLIYMGKDKFENEDLIKYGWPEDVWCDAQLASFAFTEKMSWDVLSHCSTKLRHAQRASKRLQSHADCWRSAWKPHSKSIQAIWFERTVS
jgi:hypothetical protein